MSKAKRKNPFIAVTLVAFVLSSSLFFTSADNRFFDIFLRILPSLTEDEKVFVLTLDDDSMALAGGFPFRREVYGDIVILLKELGVREIVFDLSFLDESALRFDERYTADALGWFLASSFYRLNEAAAAAVDRIGPDASQIDRALAQRNIRTASQIARDELAASVPYLGRDVDEYFARTLAFSGRSWLTLTFFPPEVLRGDAEFNTDPEIDRFLAEYIALENVVSRGDRRTPEMVGVMPAIHKLLTRARGAGFVNAGPDRDGLRRRVDLLLRYQGNYYGQLTLTAMQERLGFTSIEVTNRRITLKNDDGVLLRIPRAQDGSVLLKWPKKNFDDYNMMSLLELIQHTQIESQFMLNITEMENWGFFFYSEEPLTPWDYYLIEQEIRQEAFANNAAGGDEWLFARQNFHRAIEGFLFGPYEEEILFDVGDDLEFAEYVQELFRVSRDQFARMAEIRENASVLYGSFSVIGSDATSMTDHGLITFQENYPNVGSYAVMANMLLAGEFLSDAPRFVSAIIALLYALLIGFFISRFETHKSIITGILSLLLLSGSFAAFFLITRIYIGFSVPLITTALTFVSLIAIKFLTASREKAFLHNAFSRYLAPEIISDIINDPSKLNLGGEKRVMTAIFTDIKGFSTISEKVDPQQLVTLLNRYLTTMSNIVMRNLGTIDKYIGDAIVAFFGAPIYHEDHAVLACRSAVAMKEAEIEINKMVKEENLSPMQLFTRIGINTGEMVVGNMGAENKMDYTIMGNAVNLTARLEGVNTQYRTRGILLSEYTREKIGDEFLLRRLDRVRVVGINTPLRLYELLGIKEKATQAEIDAVEQWEKTLDLYEKQQFTAALETFKSLQQANPQDNVAGLYIERCEGYIKEPPPADWDAVRNLTEK